MQFSYIALSPEYQRLTGVISSENEKGAREQLHNMGLSVISINEHKGDTQSGDIPKEETSDNQIKNVTSFYFRVVNAQGKQLDGTIDSSSRKNAFKRLVKEYKFEIILLCKSTTPIADREVVGEEGLDEIKKEVEGELGITKKKAILENELASSDQDVRFLQRKQEILDGVSEVNKHAKDILLKYDKKISPEDKAEITTQLDNLAKMKISNNLQYIQDSTEQLFVTIERILYKHLNTTTDEVIEEDDLLVSDNDEDNDSVTTENYLRSVRQQSAIGDIKNISKKLSSLSRVKMASRGKDNESIKRGLISSLVHDAFSSVKAMIFARNGAGRRLHAKNVAHIWGKFKKDWKQGVADKEMEKISKKDTRSIKRHKGFNAESPFLYETRIFISWLLSFYILYIFTAFYLKLKWGEEFPMFDFIEKSLSAPFIFIFTSILFFALFGLSLKKHFMEKGTTVSVIITFSTILITILFLFNV